MGEMTPEMIEWMFNHKDKALEALEKAKQAMEKDIGKNLKKLVTKKFITNKQAEKYNKKEYAELLDAVANVKAEIKDDDKLIMVTSSEVLLKERKSLQKIFQIKILTPGEAVAEIESKTEQSKPSYIG